MENAYSVYISNWVSFYRYNTFVPFSNLVYFLYLAFYNQVVFGWGKTIMASLWLEIFFGLTLISPLWVAQHSVANLHFLGLTLFLQLTVHA